MAVLIPLAALLATQHQTVIANPKRVVNVRFSQKQPATMLVLLVVSTKTKITQLSTRTGMEMRNLVPFIPD